MTSTAPPGTPPAGTAERRRWIDWMVALLWLGAIVSATVQHGVRTQNNNFRIFRAAARHLVAGTDLYAAYPAEHFDFYKYSPTFALLFAPFAYVPFPLGVLFWNALNAGALFVAIGLVLPRRAATVARAIVFLDMLGSLQNAQSNALVAASIILAFAAYERHHTALGSLAAIVGTYIKLFPLAGASFAIFHPRKLRVALALAAGMVVFVVLPLLVTSPQTLLAQYASWHAIEQMDTHKRGYSVMTVVEQLFGADLPNWPIQLVGLLLLLAPVVVQRWRWHDWDLRRLYLCSVLVFCVIFNHAAESPSFVVAIAGAGIWFAAIPRPSRWEWTLLGAIVVLTILASSDVMPDRIQRDFFDRYRFKTVPLIGLWIELQRRLWFPRVREARPT
ncbi:MAG TPA: glycosyltransferase family 87 protein [Gemmatimonadaceae bacterium]|nr:glycosyltransferase family 87 protein [Gemmatimonadaceae bacterium]